MAAAEAQAGLTDDAGINERRVERIMELAEGSVHMVLRMQGKEARMVHEGLLEAIA